MAAALAAPPPGVPPLPPLPPPLPLPPRPPRPPPLPLPPLRTPPAATRRPFPAPPTLVARQGGSTRRPRATRPAEERLCTPAGGGQCNDDDDRCQGTHARRATDSHQRCHTRQHAPLFRRGGPPACLGTFASACADLPPCTQEAAGRPGEGSVRPESASRCTSLREGLGGDRRTSVGVTHHVVQGLHSQAQPLATHRRHHAAVHRLNPLPLEHGPMRRPSVSAVADERRVEADAAAAPLGARVRGFGWAVVRVLPKWDMQPRSSAAVSSSALADGKSSSQHRAPCACSGNGSSMPRWSRGRNISCTGSAPRRTRAPPARHGARACARGSGDCRCTGTRRRTAHNRARTPGTATRPPAPPSTPPRHLRPATTRLVWTGPGRVVCATGVLRPSLGCLLSACPAGVPTTCQELGRCNNNRVSHPSVSDFESKGRHGCCCHAMQALRCLHAACYVDGDSTLTELKIRLYCTACSSQRRI
jgi:hypothetical protein